MIGRTLGSFRIVEPIGRGFACELFRATHVDRGTPAVLKVVRPSEDGPEPWPASLARSAEDRLRQEAAILRRFRHPGIVGHLADGRADGLDYLATEEVGGETLAEQLRRRGPLPWPEAAALGVSICGALAHAHDRGVVHRNLHPAAIHLVGPGRVVLAGFENADFLDDWAAIEAESPPDSGPRVTGSLLGIPAYMAPEQVRGTPRAGPRTDLYALGVVLFEAVAGSRPFEGKTPIETLHQTLSTQAPRARKRVRDLPRRFDALLARLLEKVLALRPADAASVEAELRAIERGPAGDGGRPLGWLSRVLGR